MTAQLNRTGVTGFAARRCLQDFGGVAGQERCDGRAEAGENAAVPHPIRVILAAGAVPPDSVRRARQQVL